MSIRDLKKNRSSLREKILAEVDKIKSGNGGGRHEDDRFWQPTKDPVGNATATIRFLPVSENSTIEVPWVSLFSHNFQGPGGKWFIEKCPTTLNQKCPVCEANSVLWNSPSNKEENQRIVRERKRKLTYISNILVVDDPKNAENNGKVKLFRYGSKIFDKLNSAMCPDDEDETAIIPFDLWEGANFKLKVRKKDGYVNYDKSVFLETSPISEDEDAIEEIWKKQYVLDEFIEPKQFKSYDELKSRLNFVLLGNVVEEKDEEETDGEEEEAVVERAVRKPTPSKVAHSVSFEEDDVPDFGSKKNAPKVVSVEKVEEDDEESSPPEDENEEDIMNYIKRLTADDE